LKHNNFTAQAQEMYEHQTCATAKIKFKITGDDPA
jgi:hypothetical protein